MAAPQGRPGSRSLHARPCAVADTAAVPLVEALVEVARALSMAEGAGCGATAGDGRATAAVVSFTVALPSFLAGAPDPDEAVFYERASRLLVARQVLSGGASPVAAGLPVQAGALAAQLAGLELLAGHVVEQLDSLDLAVVTRAQQQTGRLLGEVEMGQRKSRQVSVVKFRSSLTGAVLAELKLSHLATSSQAKDLFLQHTGGGSFYRTKLLVRDQVLQGDVQLSTTGLFDADEESDILVVKEEVLELQRLDPKEAKSARSSRDPRQPRYRLESTVVGPSRTGKSCFVQALLGERFVEEYVPTSPFIRVYHAVFYLCDGATVQLDVHDSGGRHIGEFGGYNLDSEYGLLLCFAIDDKASFDDVVIPEVRMHVRPGYGETEPRGDRDMIFVGLKGDRDESRQVSRQEAEQLARQHGAPYFEVSALTGDVLAPILYGVSAAIDRKGHRPHFGKGGGRGRGK